MSKQKTNIVVLGGGYAGVMASLRIAGRTKRMDTAVTLINGLDYFVERPRLHEQATGAELHGRALSDMIAGTKATFVQGWVTGIIPIKQRMVVDTADGRQQILYDYLVIALGSHVERETVPGVNKYAFTLDPHGPMTTEALEWKLKGWRNKVFWVVVGGGGATGIEAAAQIKATYPLSDVTLVS